MLWGEGKIKKIYKKYNALILTNKLILYKIMQGFLHLPLGNPIIHMFTVLGNEMTMIFVTNVSSCANLSSCGRLDTGWGLPAMCWCSGQCALYSQAVIFVRVKFLNV